MNTHLAVRDAPTVVQRLVKIYSYLLIVIFALVPAYLTVYLFFAQDPTFKFENHVFHEVAIGVATLEGLFVTYVTWQCYRSSGERLLRWLTLGFLGFVVIYSLHGAFTGLAHHNIWLFLLYGPASRLVMSALLFVGLLSYHRANDVVEKRLRARDWTLWLGLFLLVDVAVAYVAYSPVAAAPAVRLGMEGGAFVFSMLNVVTLMLRRIRSPLMIVYGISIAWFGLSSLAFIFARPWNPMWWLAHAIFAAGFFLLSYGVVEAFRTTRSFSTIYSQEELMARLAEAVARTDGVLHELQRTNQKLIHLAATDPLTGVANRRHFLERAEAEVVRAKRGGAPFSLLALDLDNFKDINDSYGHQIGDEVLRRFVEKCADAIRPYDGVSRTGGEEFMVLLPQSVLESARKIGERVRIATASGGFEAGVGRLIKVTVSIGVSQFGRDGDTIDAVLRVADERLYRAKNLGRNCVVAT